MRIIRSAVLGATLLLVAASPAHAFNWGLGLDLGYSSIDPDEGESISVSGWPGFGVYVAPGMRVSFAPEGNSPHMVYLDTSLLMISVSGDDQSYTTFIGNYQYNWPVGGNTGPYLTAGAGAFLYRISGGGDVNATSAIFGGGVGVRHKMGNGHGTVRAEVRYDKLSKGEDSGTTVIPESGVFAVRLGFDLWDK